ncbi:MAG: RNA recognition motif domain-containing protein [Gammaproteobacteria bacterium]
MNIYVGNLPYSVKSEELRDAFAPYGTVTAAEVIFDRRTKRSRGYGFVEMADDEAGRKAIAALNGSDFQGRELRVDESQPREQKAERHAEGGERRAPRAPSHAPRADKPATPAAPAPRGGVFGFVKRLFG